MGRLVSGAPAGAGFDLDIKPGGYAWWYLDALSDDGRHGLCVIAFLGSVFSPYYAAARRRSHGHLADALDHVAVNVALYRLDGRNGSGWAMTERGRAALDRSARHLAIGPSRLEWAADEAGDALVIHIDEITVPLPRRLRGTIRVRLPAEASATPSARPFTLDANGYHQWQPIAPAARIDVAFDRPELCWSGRAYVDHNRGGRPLESDFVRWDWSRARLLQSNATDEANGSTAVFYDVQRRDGTTLALALGFHNDGRMRTLPALPQLALPASGWRLHRATRGDAGGSARLVHALEDAPFYARSVIEAPLFGAMTEAVHESLSLTRFDARWVQTLLPFRMPRRRGKKSSD